MMRFFNNDIFSEPGSPIKIVYSPVVNDDGTISLQKSGQENLQDYIESFGAECDINVIIARFANGEVDVLNKRMGSFGDFTKFPSTYGEMLQVKIDSDNYFAALPVELKEKFNNDSNKFFTSTGSKEWTEIMSKFYSKDSSADDLVIEKDEKGDVKE